MISLTGTARRRAAQLFTHVPQWRAFIESAIEDGAGTLVVDREADPRAAVLFYGGPVIYAGDPDAPNAADLIRHFPVQPAILGWSPAWNRRITAVLGDRLRRSERYFLPFTTLDHTVYRAVLANPARRPVPVTTGDFLRLRETLDWEHHLYHYPDMETFLARGHGFLIKKGGEIRSGASAFAVSSRSAECQVTTVPAARRQGLARIAAAAYLASCARQELQTPWDAANKASVQLGESLGFSRVIPYEIYSLV